MEDVQYIRRVDEVIVVLVIRRGDEGIVAQVLGWWIGGLLNVRCQGENVLA